jgi:hypothetical protein
MYYCYTHGGKEAWAQLQSATKDGIEVTKDWIMNKIAEDNGLDTSGSAVNDMSSELDEFTTFNPGYELSVGDTFHFYNDATDTHLIYRIDSITVSNNHGYYAGFKKYDARLKRNKTGFQKIGVVTEKLTHHFQLSIVSEHEPFNPLDYPNLYGPQVLYANAYNALMEGIPPVLDWAMRDDAPAIDPEKDQVIEVPVVASNGSGEVMDKDGKYHPAPPGLTDPVDGLGAPSLDPSSVGSKTVSGPQGTAPVNSALDDALGQAGISEGATVTGVTGQTVTWTDAQGIPHVSVVDPAVARELGKVADAVGALEGARAEASTADYELDLGGIDDPGQIDVPFFDPDFLQPEKKDVSSVMDALMDLLPGGDLLQGSRIEASGCPTMTLSFPGFDPITLDFSTYQSSVSAIGSILFSIVCLGCLIAVVKG